MSCSLPRHFYILNFQSTLPFTRLLRRREKNIGRVLYSRSASVTKTKRTRKPSLEVVPTTSAQRTRRATETRYLVKCIHSRKTIIFSSYDREIWPMIFTFELYLDRVNVNHHGKYLGQRPFCSKVIVRTQTDTQTNTYQTDCSLYRRFPDNHFPGQTFPGQDLSWTRRFPYKTFPGQSLSRTDISRTDVSRTSYTNSCT